MAKLRLKVTEAASGRTKDAPSPSPPLSPKTHQPFYPYEEGLDTQRPRETYRPELTFLFMAGMKERVLTQLRVMQKQKLAEQERAMLEARRQLAIEQCAKAEVKRLRRKAEAEGILQEDFVDDAVDDSVEVRFPLDPDVTHEDFSEV